MKLLNFNMKKAGTLESHVGFLDECTLELKKQLKKEILDLIKSRTGAYVTDLEVNIKYRFFTIKDGNKNQILERRE